jgi:hypothetical protein
MVFLAGAIKQNPASPQEKAIKQHIRPETVSCQDKEKDLQWSQDTHLYQARRKLFLKRSVFSIFSFFRLIYRLGLYTGFLYGLLLFWRPIWGFISHIKHLLLIFL